MRGILFLCLLVFLPLSHSAESSKHKLPGIETGQPIIQTFPNIDYPNGSQNWGITQDNQGIVYVANVTNNILEFDGATWRRITVPNTTTVRSLTVSKDNRVYVGAVGEIGYLEPDDKGYMSYVSLLDKLPEEERDFADVWRAYTVGDDIYFSTFVKVLRYDGNTFSFWKSASTFHTVFTIDDRLFVRERGTGLLELKDEKLVLIPDGEKLAEKRIYSMLKISDKNDQDKILIGTRSSGWYIYDNSRLTPWHTEVGNELTENWLYSAKLLPHKRIAVGTLRNGIYILDYQGRLLNHINRDSGLPDNAIHALYLDQQGGLWCTLGSGIARIDIDAPFSRFSESTGLKGLPLVLKRFKQQLYIGASDGLSRITSKQNGLPFVEPLPYIKGQVWDLKKWDDTTLIVAAAQGVYAFSGDQETLLRSSQQVSMSVHKSSTNPNRLWIGMQDGIASVRRENGQWIDEGRLLTSPAEIRQMIENKNGEMWVGTNGANVLKIVFPPNWMPGDKFQLIEYGEEHGLSDDRRSYTYQINKGVRFSTNRGILYFDARTESFTKDPSFASIYSYNQGHKNPMLQNSDGSVWVLSEDPNQQTSELGLAVPGANGKYEWESKEFRPVEDVAIADAIYQDDDGVAWFGGDMEIYRYDPKMLNNNPKPFTTLIRRVSKRTTSETVYAGAGNLTDHEFEYEHNALRFEYAATNFRYLEKNQFQVKLSGVDNDWTKWSSEAYRDYSSIPPGNYQFFVRSKNIFDDLGGEKVFEFSVLAPWYKTNTIIVVYFLITALLIFGAVHWRSKILINRNRKLSELVKQKTHELEKINAELTEQSVTDALTGLKNRRFLQDNIHEDVAVVDRHYQSLERGENNRLKENSDLLFIMIDLDHFKQVNDEYGHAVGDTILTQMRNILFSAVRETDTPIRWGGEEFLVLARFVDPQHASQLPERIRSSVEKHKFDIGNGNFLHKTCSIGFASFPLFHSTPNGVDWEQVIDIADQCLYAAKKSGRNTWVGVRSSDKAPDFDQSRLKKSAKELLDEGYLVLSSLLSDPHKLKW